jgi:bifunctional UDP-N-acetylglucosamine pyrophosphorylase/glucosamine-1-phosphate N-acetyltransferase
MPKPTAILILPDDTRMLRAEVAGRAAAGHLLDRLLASEGLTVRALVDENSSSQAWWRNDHGVATVTSGGLGDLLSASGVLFVDARAWLPLGLVTRVLQEADAAPSLLRVADSSSDVRNPSITVLVYVSKGVGSREILTRATTRPGRGLEHVIQADFLSRARSLEIPHHDSLERPLVIDSYVELARFEQQVLLDRAIGAMKRGVRIHDPRQVFIRGELECGPDVELEVNVVIEGLVRLGEGVRVGANSILRHAEVHQRSNIKPFSMIEESSIGADCNIGPYARIRPGSVLGDAVQIGNYVEIKSSNIGSGSRINHHSFIGDADVAERVTIGAGTITCNHDGVRINRTIVERDAYIGSGCNLVAPIKVGEGATVGAGSTVTRDVPPGKLTVARATQDVVEGWRGPKDK